MHSPSPIMMSTEATAENFDEKAYLVQNGDVARAIKAGMFYQDWTAGAQAPAATASVADTRARKLEKLRPHLRTDMPYRPEGGRLNFLTRELRNETRIVDTENVSANPYDDEMMKLIETHKDGLILDCGAGRRDIFRKRPELRDRRLRFHGRDRCRRAPTLRKQYVRRGVLHRRSGTCARSLPMHGGDRARSETRRRALLLHALPSAAARLPASLLQRDAAGRPAPARGFFASRKRQRLSRDAPVWALTWIVRSWSEGFNEPTRSAFLNMQFKELVVPAEPLLTEPFSRDLSREKQFELATGTITKAVKETTMRRLRSRIAPAWSRSP